MILKLDHISVLLRSIVAAQAKLPSELILHEIETFESEGTKEQYIDLSESDDRRLLLMEAIGDGPYKRALQKRGPGLHHFGCATDNLNKAVDHFSQFGLLLHPISLNTLKNSVVWMCRPGVPFLIELYESPELTTENEYLLSIQMRNLPQLKIDWIPGLKLIRSSSPHIHISLGDTHFSIEADCYQKS